MKEQPLTNNEKVIYLPYEQIRVMENIYNKMKQVQEELLSIAKGMKKVEI